MRELLQRPLDAPEERALTQALSPGYDQEFRRFLARGELPSGVSARMPFSDLELRQQELKDIASGGLWAVASSEFSAELLAAADDVSPVRRVCRIVPTASGGEMMTPMTDDRQEGVLPSESETISQVDAVAGRLVVPAYMFCSNIIVASWQLVGDLGPKLDSWLARLGGARIGRRLNRALTTGDNANAPQGCIYGVATGVTAAATGGVTNDELLQLEDSLDAVFRYEDGTRYMMASSTLSAIRRLVDSTGRPIAWAQDPTGRNKAGQVHGFDVVINSAMPTMAAGARSIVFGDWSQFVCRDVQGSRVQVLKELYAADARTGYLIWSRHGSGWMNAGTSPAVVLVQAA